MIDMPIENITLKEKLTHIAKRQKSIHKEKEDLEICKIKMARHWDTLAILLDSKKSIACKNQERKKQGLTRQTFALNGWTPKDTSENLKQSLEAHFDLLYIHIREPHEKDGEPPILLKNHSLAQPFEVVTNLYGQPSYYAIDPTPWMAPFFALFFGTCLGDAGYGLILALLCALGFKKLKPSGTMRKFLLLFFMSGLTSILIGVITGSWFGDFIQILPDMQWLKTIRKSLMVFDPLQNPQTFFYLSLIMGYFQIYFGLLINFGYAMFYKKFDVAFFDAAPWLGILAGVPMLFVSSLKMPGTILIALSVITVLLFNARSARSWFGRIGGGLYRLYGGVDYLKDILSYSRLFALGLGTSIMALAINNISLLVGGIPIIGIPLMLTVLII